MWKMELVSRVQIPAEKVCVRFLLMSFRKAWTHLFIFNSKAGWSASSIRILTHRESNERLFHYLSPITIMTMQSSEILKKKKLWRAMTTYVLKGYNIQGGGPFQDKIWQCWERWHSIIQVFPLAVNVLRSIEFNTAMDDWN